MLYPAAGGGTTYLLTRLASLTSSALGSGESLNRRSEGGEMCVSVRGLVC